MEKVLEVLAKHPWDFIVFKTDNGFVMNVVFHASAMDFLRSFRLNEREALQSIEWLKKFSERIRNDYESVKDREITPVITK